jgi:GT2 family glycosyltransferase
MTQLIESVAVRRVNVIIVTFNSAEDIVDCLSALYGSSRTCTLQVTVVDNASTDNTVELLSRFPKAVRVIRNPSNVGYARGNNMALSEILAQGDGESPILILNPDVALPVGSLDRLWDLLHSSPEIGAVSPFVHEAVSQPRRMCRLRPLTSVRPILPRKINGHTVLICDRLHGCCMLAKSGLFRKVGVFDESYFLYLEEIDLCYRARKAGLKLLIACDVNAGHRVDRLERPHRVYYMWRNRGYFASKNLRGLDLAHFWVRQVIIRGCLEVVGYFLARRFDLVCAASAGFVAWLKSETGRSSSRYAWPTTNRAP